MVIPLAGVSALRDSVIADSSGPGLWNDLMMVKSSSNPPINIALR